MFGLSKYIIIGLGIALAIASGIIYWQYAHIEQLNKDVATERANVVTAKTEIKGLNDNILLLEELREQDQEAMDNLGKEVNRVEEERNEAKTKLDAFRARINRVSLRKPGLVGRAASRASNKLFRDFHTATGGTPDQAGGTIPPDPSGPDTPAK